MKKKEIRFEIQDQQERENLVIALANAGYSCRVVKETDNVYMTHYHVVVRLK